MHGVTTHQPVLSECVGQVFKRVECFKFEFGDRWTSDGIIHAILEDPAGRFNKTKYLPSKSRNIGD